MAVVPRDAVAFPKGKNHRGQNGDGDECCKGCFSHVPYSITGTLTREVEGCNRCLALRGAAYGTAI